MSTDENTLENIALDKVRYREARGRDIDRMLDLRNRIFPPITRKQFDSVEGLTACVGLLDGIAVAALPLAIREFQLGPSETCRAAFLHAVGTHSGCRGMGVGSALTQVAAKTLRGRVDALMVFRTGGERTAGYAFYKKAGFQDLMFATILRLRRRRVAQGNVTITSSEQAILARGNALRDIFIKAHGSMGGYWARTPGFYERALRSSYFCSRPHDFLLLETRARGRTTGYALLGRDRILPETLKILEMVTQPGGEDAVDTLLEAAWRHAGQSKVVFPTSAASPLRSAVLPWVKEESVRSPVLLGMMLNPTVRAARLTIGPRKPSFKIWTPSGDLSVNKPTKTSPTLGLRDDALQRLFFRRLSLRHALANEAATLHGAKENEAATLDAAMPSQTWIYHALDYL